MKIEKERSDSIERLVYCAFCRASQRIKAYDCTGNPNTCNSCYGERGRELHMAADIEKD